MITAQALLAALSAHPVFDSTEEKYVASCMDLAMRHPGDWWRRALAEGHFTASAWVTDAACRQALLLHHAKLNRWLQPGGHLDEEDDSPAAGALREAREESGIARLTLFDGRLFDVDVHEIPERGNEARHFHYDLRYRVVAVNTAITLSSESLGYRWMDLLSLCDDNADEGLARMARKSIMVST